MVVDRVDEPYLINGSSSLYADASSGRCWITSSHKHSGIWAQALLPIELEHAIDRQERVTSTAGRSWTSRTSSASLAWTGQSLYDLANARLKACASDGKAPMITESAGTSDRRGVWRCSLRLACRAFVCFYRFFGEMQCNALQRHSPVWKIDQGEFESVARSTALRSGCASIGEYRERVVSHGGYRGLTITHAQPARWGKLCGQMQRRHADRPADAERI